MTDRLEMTTEELIDKSMLEQTQEIIANCPSFGKPVCQYTKEGIVGVCWECREAYRIVPI